MEVQTTEGPFHLNPTRVLQPPSYIFILDFTVSLNPRIQASPMLIIPEQNQARLDFLWLVTRLGLIAFPLAFIALVVSGWRTVPPRFKQVVRWMIVLLIVDLFIAYAISGPAIFPGLFNPNEIKTCHVYWPTVLLMAMGVGLALSATVINLTGSSGRETA